MDIRPKLVSRVWTDPQGTLRAFQSDLRAAGKKGDLLEQRELTRDLGHVYYLLGFFDDAADKYSQALDLYKSAGDPDGEGFLTNNLGGAYEAAGAYAKAEPRLESALAKFRGTGNAKGQAMAMNNLGVMASHRGRFSAATAHFRQALAFAGEETSLRALQLANLARVYASWGMFKAAADLGQELVSLQRDRKDPLGLAHALTLLAEVFNEWGKKGTAIEQLEDALQLAEEKTPVFFRANNLLGGIYLDLGEPGRAAQYIEQGEYRSGLGRLSLARGDVKGAEKHYQALAKTGRRFNRIRDRFTAETGLGLINEARERFRTAQQHYSQAMEFSEEIRTGLLLSERKLYFTRSISGFFPTEPAHGLIRCLLARDQPGKTIEPGEQVKARSFADQLAQQSDIAKADAPLQVIKREEELFNRLAALAKARALMPRRRDPKRFDGISRRIVRAEKELHNFMATLRKTSKQYAAARVPTPVTLRDLRFDPQEYLVVFDCVRTGVAVKLLQGRKITHSDFVEWEQDRLKEDVERFRRPFESVRLREFDQELARKFYRRLLSDVLEKVPEGAAITIVPDSILGLLPFEALVVRGTPSWSETDYGPALKGLTYVGDVHPVRYAQSLTALTLLRQDKTVTNELTDVLVFADPVFGKNDPRITNTPEATGEQTGRLNAVALMSFGTQRPVILERLAGTSRLAESVEQIFPGATSTRLGLDATKSELFELDLSNFGTLVFATHGFLSLEIPGIMEPGLALTMVPQGTDGFLRMTEVSGLRLKANLVALTACQTGLGRIVQGEGVMSLGRAFQLAGGESVLTSLWSVAEQSSVLLVTSFFERVRRGRDHAQALQGARSDVRAAGFEHPFHWAAFILTSSGIAGGASR
jgi:CHAT domain-containing protein/Flp pilus assembly protein TadD